MLQTLDGVRLGADLERWEDEGGALAPPWPFWSELRVLWLEPITIVSGPPGAKVLVTELKEGEAPPPAPVNFRGIVK